MKALRIDCPSCQQPIELSELPDAGQESRIKEAGANRQAAKVFRRLAFGSWSLAALCCLGALASDPKDHWNSGTDWRPIVQAVPAFFSLGGLFIFFWAVNAILAELKSIQIK